MRVTGRASVCVSEEAAARCRQASASAENTLGCMELFCRCSLLFCVAGEGMSGGLSGGNRVNDVHSLSHTQRAIASHPQTAKRM